MIDRRTLWISSLALVGLAACERTPTSISYADPDATAPAIGGPFELVDENGQPVTEAVLQGKWTAIYFGFTYCPDVCPLSLQSLKEGLDKLGDRGRQVQTILISVDPERDTPEVMKAYVNNEVFPTGLRGFTGAPEQIEAAAKAYKVFYQKQDDGLVQHQSIIFLMDPQGGFARALTHALTPDEIAAQIGDAMRQAG